MVQSAGDWWLQRRTMSRDALTDYLTTLIWGGMAGVLGSAGSTGIGRPSWSPPLWTPDPEGDQPIANPTRRTSSGAIST